MTENGKIRIHRVSTHDNPADLMIKAMTREKLIKFGGALNLQDPIFTDLGQRTQLQLLLLRHLVIENCVLFELCSCCSCHSETLSPNNFWSNCVSPTFQRHSGRNLLDPTLHDNVIQSNFFQYIYHVR